MSNIIASIVVEVQAEKTQVAPEATGPLLHGLLLNLVKAANPKLATKWHDTQGLKTFSLSPLFGRLAKSSSGALVIKSQPYWFKIGLLGQQAYDTVLTLLSAKLARKELIFVGSLPFSINKIKLSGHPWATVSTTDELIKSPLVTSELVFQFKTPTTFRRLDFNYILPEPKLVFGSLLNRWQLFQKNSLELDIDRLNDILRIRYFNLKSQFFPLKNQNLVGFQGKVAFEPSNKATKEEIKAVSCLAKFALFSGVGQKTTMGMGVCRQL